MSDSLTSVKASPQTPLTPVANLSLPSLLATNSSSHLSSAPDKMSSTTTPSIQADTSPNARDCTSEQVETSWPSIEASTVAARLRPLPNHFHQYHRYGHLLVAEPIPSQPNQTSYEDAHINSQQFIPSPDTENQLHTHSHTMHGQSSRLLTGTSQPQDPSQYQYPDSNTQQFIRNRQTTSGSSTYSSSMSLSAREQGDTACNITNRSSTALATNSPDHRMYNSGADSIPGTRAFLTALSGRDLLRDPSRRSKHDQEATSLHGHSCPGSPSTVPSLYIRSIMKCPPQLHYRQDTQESVSSLGSTKPRRRQDTQATLTSNTSATSAEYSSNWLQSCDTMLEKIAIQRTLLLSMEQGMKDLMDDVQTLDETIVVENEVKGELVEDAHEAIEGWEGTWKKYDQCEPVSALRKRPKQLAQLVHDMDWQVKKIFFQMLVKGLCGREVYHLQQLIQSDHGDVQGFDILADMPVKLSGRIMRHLRFVDLASCRLVCKSWYNRVMTYDTLKSAIDRFTQVQEAPRMNKRQPPRVIWNLLCRLYQRELSWRKGKPIRIDEFYGHTNYVTSIKEREGWIVSGGYDEVICLWEAATGICTRLWHVGSSVSCVDLHVDRKLDGGGVIVAAFVDVGVVKVWPMNGAQCMHTLVGHQKGVRALAMNDRFLVTAGFDQTLIVWDWLSGKKIANFRAHNETILNVHLVGSTVYTICIDASLRIYDIPSRILLNHVKMMDAQPGSTLQWSCLRDNILLTATNKKVYIWRMESQEFPGGQSLSPQVHGVSRMQTRLRSKSVMSQSSETSLSPSEDDHGTPPYSPMGSTSNSVGDKLSRPATPAFGGSLSLNSLREAPYFYQSSNSSASSCSLLGRVDSVETRVNPCLTTVLNVTTDMWCGELTRHNPPLLILGSRSSTVKLVTVVITKEMLETPARADQLDYTPRQLYPKPIPVQGLSSAQGKGIMCIESDADKMVVGCTGGSIHVIHMDPACVAMTLHSKPTIHSPTMLAASAQDTHDFPIKLPNGTTSTLNLAPLSTSSSAHLRKSITTLYRTTSSSVVPKFSLPSPEHSPLLSNGSSTFTASLESPLQNFHLRYSGSSSSSLSSTGTALTPPPEGGNRTLKRRGSLLVATGMAGSPQGLPFDDSCGQPDKNPGSPTIRPTATATTATTTPAPAPAATATVTPLSPTQRKKSSDEISSTPTPTPNPVGNKKKSANTGSSAPTAPPSSGHSSPSISTFSTRIKLRRRTGSAAWSQQQQQQDQQQGPQQQNAVNQSNNNPPTSPTLPSSPPPSSLSSSPSTAVESCTSPKSKKSEPSLLATVVGKKVSHRFSIDSNKLFSSGDSSSNSQPTGLSFSRSGWSISSPFQSPRRQSMRNKT